MPERPTYSLQILLGTIAAFAVAAGAFAAPQSFISGLLVLVIGTSWPALLLVIWRSGPGYRRSFALAAMAPAVACGYFVLWPLAAHPGRIDGFSGYTSWISGVGADLRWYVFLLLSLSLCGGLASMGVHWLFKSGEDPCQDDTF